jgi:DNA invertase Pin-like site-specific DNA recombinase
LNKGWGKLGAPTTERIRGGGVAKAKAEGKYKGRAPTARAKASEVLRLRGEGVGPTEIGKRLKIGRASVYRILSTGAD